MLLKESDKIRCKASSLTSINQKALLIAASDEENTEMRSGREKERVSRRLKKAHPTHSTALDPLVNVNV